MYCVHVWFDGAAKVWNSVAPQWAGAWPRVADRKLNTIYMTGLTWGVVSGMYFLSLLWTYAVHEDPEAKEVVGASQADAECVQRDGDEHGECIGYLLAGCTCYEEVG
jgi:hypothetical protein